MIVLQIYWIAIHFPSFKSESNEQAHFSLKWLWWITHTVRMNIRVAFVKKGLCPRINAAIWVIGLKKKGYNQKDTTKNILT